MGNLVANAVGPVPDYGATIDVTYPNLMVAPASIGLAINYDDASFDTEGPSSGTYDRRLHDIYVFWDLGAAIGSDYGKTVNVLTEWKSRRYPTGPFIRVAFPAGTHTISALIVEPSSGKQMTVTRTLTAVADPDTYFTGTNNICVDTAGTPNWTGAPSGSDNYTTLAAALTAYAALATPGRLMLKGGQTYSAAEITFSDTLSGYVTSYGTGRAILDNTVHGDAIFTINQGSTTDFRVVNLAFTGPCDTTVNDTSPDIVIGVVAGTGGSKILINNCTFDGCSLFQTTGGKFCHIDDCSITDWGGYFVGVYTTDGTSNLTTEIAATGNLFAQNPNAFAGANRGGGNFRIEYANKTYIAGNDFFGCTGSVDQDSYPQPCFKWITTAMADGPKLNCHSNSFEGGDIFIVGARYSHVDGGINRKFRVNAIFDGNAVLACHTSQKALEHYGSGWTVRNNQFTVPAITSGTTREPFSVFLAWGGGIADPDLAGDTPNKVYGNSFAMLRTKTQNNPFSSPDEANAWCYGTALTYDADMATNYPGTAYSGAGCFKDNVDHAPSLSTGGGTNRVAFATVDVTQLWAARTLGVKLGSVGSMNTNYASTKGPVASTLSGGSPGLDITPALDFYPPRDGYGDTRADPPNAGWVG
jgi:hypothetical protein